MDCSSEPTDSSVEYQAQVASSPDCCFVFSFICMDVLPAFMLVQQMCVWYLWNQEEGVGSPKPEVIHGCELLCGFWEPNLDYQNVNKCSSPRTT